MPLLRSYQTQARRLGPCTHFCHVVVKRQCSSWQPPAARTNSYVTQHADPIFFNMARRGTRFCCCAFPLVKFGAYLLVIETAFVALCLGILALAPPPIVGGMDAIPSWGKYVVAVIAFVLAAWQILGLCTVVTDSPWSYKLYSRMNFMATVVLLCFTIAFTVTAAAKHNDSIEACLNEFERPLANDGYGVDEVQDRLDQGRHDVCNYLGWADVGLMGGLVVVVGLLQLYMCYMQGQYGKRQRAAQKETLSQRDAGSIPMNPTSTWTDPSHGAMSTGTVLHAPSHRNAYEPVMLQDNSTQPLYQTYSH